MNKSTEIFESHRPRLFHLAYGMLSRVAPAEDAVQESYIRWQKQEPDQIKSPGAWLSTVVSRICLDELKSARNRREEYIGPNLPEPIIVSKYETPDDGAELAETLSMAMLVVMDKLNPLQRAVFILRDIFDYDYASVGNILHKSESNCRKIAQRARQKIGESKLRFERNSLKKHAVVSAFIDAIQGGNLSKIEHMLAKEAILYSDGGGKVTAARKPIFTASKIARFLLGIQKQAPAKSEWWIELKDINGEPGILIWLENEIYNAWSFHIEDDKIKSIYVVLNPEKLEPLKRMV